MSRRRVVNVLNRIVVIVDVVDHLIGVVVVSLVRGDRDHGFLRWRVAPVPATPTDAAGSVAQFPLRPRCRTWGK